MLCAASCGQGRIQGRYASSGTPCVHSCTGHEREDFAAQRIYGSGPIPGGLGQAPRQRARRRVTTRFSAPDLVMRSEEHTSELQSLMRISYAVFCLKKQKKI